MEKHVCNEACRKVKAEIPWFDCNIMLALQNIPGLNYQPKRSKREDLPHRQLKRYHFKKASNDKSCLCKGEMRCSEHCGNTVRKVQ